MELPPIWVIILTSMSGFSYWAASNRAAQGSKLKMTSFVSNKKRLLNVRIVSGSIPDTDTVPPLKVRYVVCVCHNYDATQYML